MRLGGSSSVILLRHLGDFSHWFAPHERRLRWELRAWKTALEQ